jgi:hypothetical protein
LLRATKRATKQATNCSPAAAEKKGAKAPGKKVVPKPPLESKTVCFTDQDSGKKFCGEMTEVQPKKAPKVAGLRRRKR